MLRFADVSLAWLLVAAPALSGEPVDVVFKAKHDGSEQRYVVVLPDGFEADKPHSVLIVLHGHGSDRWQFVKDNRDECKAARAAAARQNMILVSPDYRAKTSWMGPSAEADLLQILAELKEAHRVDKIVISGGSMGGTAALIFAALQPEQIDGVVAMNGTANLVEYDQFQEAIAASYGGSKQEKPEEYRRRSPELHAAKLTMPIATTTGGKDRLVPADSVLRLVKTLEKEKRQVLSIHRPEGGHDTNYGDAMEAFKFVFERLRLE
jgi:dipeptidyl aminopeptidase/acylaminoacyl peptidase